MVDADHLRIVFQVNGVDFVMPVTDLLAIRGMEEDGLTPVEQPLAQFQTGSLVYRETDVKVYDLAALFELSEIDHCEEGQLLIFASDDFPWAVKVDRVAGVVDAANFEFQKLPTYMLRDEFVPYYQVALHEEKLLICLDVSQINLAWRRGC